MRKVIYSVAVSLDGYIADPDGGFDWIERATRKAGQGEDFGLRDFFRSIDTVLMGRKTYEIVEKMQGAKSVYPGMKNYVFSRTRPSGQRDGVEFVSADPADVIAELKQRPGKHIYLCGGGDLARHCLTRRAIDEIRLGILPRMIGAGLPTFPPGFDETELELTDLKQYKGGVLGLTYRVIYADAAASPKKELTNKPQVASTKFATKKSAGKKTAAKKSAGKKSSPKKSRTAAV